MKGNGWWGKDRRKGVWRVKNNGKGDGEENLTFDRQWSVSNVGVPVCLCLLIPLIQFCLGVCKCAVVSIETSPPILHMHTQPEPCDVERQSGARSGLPTTWSTTRFVDI